MKQSSEITDSAIVLRCTRYSDNDLIVSLFCADQGLVTAFARGALKAKQSLGGRIEPFSVVDVRLKSTRGDMFTLRGIDRSIQFDSIRSSWEFQKKVSVILDVLRAGVCDAECANQVFNLTHRLLKVIDSLDEFEAKAECTNALILGWALKFSHLVGIEPQMFACVRCGVEIAHTGEARVSWSAASGGATCRECSIEGDIWLPVGALNLAGRLLSEPLAHSATASVLPGPELTVVSKSIVYPQFEHHAGIQLKPL